MMKIEKLLKLANEYYIRCNASDRITDNDKIVVLRGGNNIKFEKRDYIPGYEKHNKPRGQWYAYGMSWLNHVHSEDDESEYTVYKIETNTSRILNINTNNIFEILDKYSTNELGDIGKQMKEKGYGFLIADGSYDQFVIDWKKVAKDYAGAEIKDVYGIQDKVKEYIDKKDLNFQNRHDWTDTWDIPSGCVWDSSAITKIEKIENFKNKNKIVYEDSPIKLEENLTDSAKPEESYSEESTIDEGWGDERIIVPEVSEDEAEASWDAIMKSFEEDTKKEKEEQRKTDNAKKFHEMQKQKQQEKEEQEQIEKLQALKRQKLLEEIQAKKPVEVKPEVKNTRNINKPTEPSIEMCEKFMKDQMRARSNSDIMDAIKNFIGYNMREPMGTQLDNAKRLARHILSKR